jgi:transcriptional regulator with XRE-family HTH domain
MARRVANKSRLSPRRIRALQFPSRSSPSRLLRSSKQIPVQRAVLDGFQDVLGADVRSGLTQAQLAGILGVTKFTVWNWKDCRNEPGTHQCVKSIEFIGYDPLPTGPSLAERMLAFRRRRGLRTKDAAKLAGVDPSSWSSWERTEHKITLALLKKLEALLRTWIT